MKVSLNWIKQLTSVDGSIEELVEKVGAQLGAVEEVIDTSKKYQGLLVVKVADCQKHPNADKLSLCLVDDGGVNEHVKRNADGLIQVVCGAPNVKAGMLAAWIPPGSTVPATYDKDPFVIEARPIRNKTSHGMLASAKELDIGDDHSGIVEIDKAAKPGDDFAETYKMNDYIIDIENKMFTHRPDLFGHIGVAREIAGIQGRKFQSPDWYQQDAALLNDGRKNVLQLAVKNEIPNLVPRFSAIAIKDVKVGPSPLWLRASLSRLGVKSVNNVVDVTNFYMMLTAQPLHAYDYDKVKTSVLGTRLSKKGEKIKLLNGKELALDDDDAVITDGTHPIGLAGIMGGSETEVDDGTKSIILECASFDMNQIRKSAMKYGVFTDASTRFTKNQSPRQNRAVIVKAANDLMKLAGGRVASRIIDDKHGIKDNPIIATNSGFINQRLGTSLAAKDMDKILSNVEFDVKTAGNTLEVQAPFWRTDIEIPEDIVEEVGRLYGYDKLPAFLPRRDLTPAAHDISLNFKARIRDILRRAGANEVLTYSFVHESLLKKSGQDPKQAYHIRNALSPDLQYYRLSLTPSLLDKIYPNLRAGFSQLAIFEIGKGHNRHMKDLAEKTLPMEFEMLSAVVASKDKSGKRGSPLYLARKLLDYLADELGLELEYRPIAEEEPYQAAKPFDYKRSAQVWERGSGTPLGMVGEYKTTVAKSLKLPAYCAGFEIGISQLLNSVTAHNQYQPINRFPELEQDFCLRSDVEYSYQKLTDFVSSNLKDLSKEHGYGFSLHPLDIFKKDGDKNHKQTTWRIILWHPERTLTTAETNRLLDGLAERALKELKAERI